MKRIEPLKNKWQLSHEEIEQLAYQLYQERGCEPGHELEDWVRAEEILRIDGNAERDREGRHLGQAI